MNLRVRVKDFKVNVTGRMRINQGQDWIRAGFIA